LRSPFTPSKIKAGAQARTPDIRKEAKTMTPKDRKPTSLGQKTLKQTCAEKQAAKRFNVELQRAIDKVDWGNVKLPRQCC
jgi:hypothetical protein